MMARYLAKVGHDVHVISSDRTGRNRAGRWVSETIDGFTVHWFPVPYSNSMSARQRVGAFLKFATKSATKARKLKGDLVFATSTPLTIAIPGMYATLARRTPLVLEVRDLWPELPIALGVLTRSVPIMLARLLERTAYRRSSHIVALSPGMKEGIVRQGVSADRVTVLPNVGDLDFFREDPESGERWRHQLAWLGKRQLIVHCGTIGRVNGVSYLVRLAAETRAQGADICFATVGTGAEEEEVRQLATELGVLDVNFFMLGTMPKREIAKVFSASALTLCLVIPVKELEHNSANKFFDSLAAGRPLAINYGGWHEGLLVANDCGFRFPAKNISDAATSLIQYLASPKDLEQKGKNARALAEREFSLSTIAGRLAEILEATSLASRQPK